MLDKLGVTGSSAVPPISESPANANFVDAELSTWLSQTGDLETIWKASGLASVQAN
jgi:hypothetical protein